VIFRNLAFACGTKMIVLYFRAVLLGPRTLPFPAKGCRSKFPRG